MADFSVKTGSIDPTAFATVLQRKAQIEQEQARAEQARRDSRLNRIIEAVQGGQTIASNMLTLAAQRKKLEGERELASLMQEPTTLPDTDPLKAQMESAFQADRKQRFMEALTKANPAKATEALLESQFAGMKPASASQMSLEKISVPGKGQMVVNVDKVNRKVYNLAGDDITADVGAAIPAFAPMAIESGSGVFTFRERNVPGQSVVSTQDRAIKPEKVGTVTNLVALEKRDRDKVFESINQAKNDSIITEGRKALKPLQLMRKAINEDNKAVIDRMGGLFHKAVTADVGNLAAYEQRDPNSRAIIDRIKNAGKMWAKGVPADTVRKEMLDALDSAEEVISGTMADSFDFRTEAIAEQFPQLNKEAIKRKMGAEALTKSKRTLTPEEEAEQFLKGF